ncbi:MAG: M20 family metallopeptidase [Acidobacteria bacterium]|nr:M20 family metallopeptidase [Acidobacteriota bacterium]
MKNEILRAADALRDEILEISRDLHAHPELSLEEERSARILAGKLREAGFSVSTGVAGLKTAFVARLDGRASVPTVAILAEYDALPGIGHGCGHNLIAAAGVGAGLVLARAAGAGGGATSPGLPGALMVMGTPAEETIGGKVVMVREGLFKGVDAAMMIHGGAEWRAFSDSLACASIEVTYLGRASHAVAWPEKGINALDALIQLFVAIDMLRKRLGPEVRVPGVILEGGVRPNIVPARAVGAFSIRAKSTGRRDAVRAEVERAARGIASATGCGLEIRETDEPYDDMVTNGALASRFRDHLGSMGIVTVDGPRPNKGSLDMGNVSRAVPSIHPFMLVAPEATPIHTAEFAAATRTAAAEENLMIAVKALALTAYDTLADGALLEAARREFAAIAGAKAGS